LEDKTPVEAFIGVRPKIENLRIFGCLVYIHVPKEKRTKLEPSGRNDMFVAQKGFDKPLKGFALLGTVQLSSLENLVATRK
jgi:hypothetical protein